MKPILPIFFCSMLLLLNSCKDDYSICSQPKNVFFKAGVYVATAGTEAAVTVPSFSLALLGNNYIYQNQLNVSKFLTTLNPALDSARYLISLSTTLPADTLTIVYTTATYTISPECGTVPVNTITRAYSTAHTISAVTISNPSVDLTGNENVKLYY